MARGTARSEGSTPARKRGKDFNQFEAVKKALEKLGKDAKPADINDQVMQEHGTTLSPTLISSYKSTINRKAGEQSGIHRRPGRPGKRGGAGGGKKETFSIDDLSAVKELTERLGAEKVRDLAQLFTK